MPALLAPYTVATLTPDNKLLLTRIQAQHPVAPSHCSTNGTLQVGEGTSAYTLTLTGAANDSGPLAVEYPAGAPIRLRVASAAACPGGILPALVNVVVQYRVK